MQTLKATLIAEFKHLRDTANKQSLDVLQNNNIKSLSDKLKASKIYKYEYNYYNDMLYVVELLSNETLIELQCYIKQTENRGDLFALVNYLRTAERQ